MKITLKQLGPSRWHILVYGVLPNGKPFRRRTRQDEMYSKTAAKDWALGQWNAAVAGATKDALTVQAYATTWLDARTARALSSAKANRYQLAHLMPQLGHLKLVDLTRAHIAKAIEHMTKHGKRSRGGGKIAPRTVLHSYSTLSTMLEDAVADGHIASSPATLRARRQELPVKKDKDPEWRRTAIYTAQELSLLISDERIAEPNRIAYALEGLAGLRYGEASALKWSCWTEDKPLGRLHVYEAYDSNNERLKPTKTDTARDVPVHAALAALLKHWRAGGWKAQYGRAPKPGDLIMPVLEGRTLRHRRWHEGRAPHKRALTDLGMRQRRQHDLRRTFITLCRADGGSAELLKWITHGVPASVIDSYTSPAWSVLCRFVENIKLS